MPNYGLVVTPQYNPMSYEQYAKPFEDYAKVYNQMADTYDALEMEANQWEKLALNAKDAPQYQQYKRYADDLRNAASDLADNGLSVKTRGTLSRLKKRYASEIKPIADAYALREEEMKLQRQARLTHPDIMFSREAADTGLGAYMAGVPEFQTYTEGMLTKNVSDAAKNLATEASEDLRRNGPKSKWYTILGGKYYEKATRTGLTAEDVLSSMFNPQTGEINPNANPYLEQILNDALNQSGISSWGNWDSLKERAYGALNRGLWDAIGKVEYRNLQNPDYAGGGGGKKSSQFKLINPVAIYSQRQKNADEKAINEIEKQGYVNREGKFTQKGMNRLLTQNPTPVTGGMGGPSYTPNGQNQTDSDFFETVYRWAVQDKPGLTKEQFREAVKKNPDYVAALYNKVKTDNPFAKYDANKLYEYNFHLDPNESTNHKSLIKGDLPEAEFDTTTNQWVAKKNGEVLKHADLLDNKYSITDTNFGMHGNTILVNTPEGIKEYMMPTGINPTAEESRDNAVIAASLFGLALNEGKALVYDKASNSYVLSDTPLTAKEYAEYELEKAKWELEAYNQHSKIGFKNDSKPVVYDPNE